MAPLRHYCDILCIKELQHFSTFIRTELRECITTQVGLPAEQRVTRRIRAMERKNGKRKKKKNENENENETETQERTALA